MKKLLSVLLILLFFVSCKKDDNKIPAPAITGISQKTDTVGAVVIISGSNFSTTSSLDIVKFGDITAVVTNATVSQLTVIVPTGAQNGPVTVTVNGQSATSTETFTVLGPTIADFSPTLAGIAYPVIITGNNFSADISMDKVTVNGSPAIISAASSTQLTITVPDDASTGKIIVSVKGQHSTSQTDLQIIKLTVTTLAGTGLGGNLDGAGNIATFSAAWGITPDGQGNYYVADVQNNKIRKVADNGTVSTFAGTGTWGYKNGFMDTATFGNPYGVTFDKEGNMYIADLGANHIRKISTIGLVSTFAGDLYGNSGTTDGTGNNARFSAPLGIAVDGNDNIFVVDAQNAKIRKITQAGVVTTFAGSGAYGSSDGNGTAASFKNPYAIAIDAANNLYVTDAGGKTIRKITPTGDVTTIAGSGASGSADGQGTSASFASPAGIAVDPAGNIYVTDNENGRIRMITPSGLVVTLAGNGVKNSVDGVGNHASFSNPLGIAADGVGVLVVVDNATNKIRKIVVQ